MNRSLRCKKMKGVRIFFIHSVVPRNDQLFPSTFSEVYREQTSDPPTHSRVHTHRTFGGHRDHCHPDWPVTPRGSEGAGSRGAHVVYEQPQATIPWHNQLCRHE